MVAGKLLLLLRLYHEIPAVIAKMATMPAPTPIPAEVPVPSPWAAVGTGDGEDVADTTPNNEVEVGDGVLVLEETALVLVTFAMELDEAVTALDNLVVKLTAELELVVMDFGSVMLKR
jgi:hypothetical protein